MKSHFSVFFERTQRDVIHVYLSKGTAHLDFSAFGPMASTLKPLSTSFVSVIVVAGKKGHTISTVDPCSSF